MSDPRAEHKWKQTRYEQRVELLLGAILDAIREQTKVTDVPRKAIQKTTKADKA